MAEQQTHKPGGHYSGANPVPTISKFIESLDKDKKNRDAKIDSGNVSTNTTGGEAIPHKPSQKTKQGTQKTVTDPVTGQDVVIEDASKDLLQQVNNPMVSTQYHQTFRNARLTQIALGAQRKSRQRHSEHIAFHCLIFHTNKLDSLSRPTNHNQTPNTSTTKISQHLQIP
jgi:hypothetical protein